MMNGNEHAETPGLTEIAGTWVTPRVDVLGVGVSAIDMPMTLRLIDQWISQGDRQYICVTDVHAIMESQRDPRIRNAHNCSGLTTPDGMPLVWAGRAAGAHHMSRVYGPDLMLAVCQRASSRGYSSFFYGGRLGVADRLARHLQQLYPELKIAGTYAPPFRELSADEDEEIVQLISAARPDLVWVGLGAPRQELWMAAHAGRLRGQRPDRSRRRVRHPCRADPSGAPLGPAFRSGMGVPAGAGAAAAVGALSLQQPPLPRRYGTEAPMPSSGDSSGG